MARFWISAVTIAAMTVWSAGCADPPPDDPTPTGADATDGTGADGAISADGAVADGTVAGDGASNGDAGGNTGADGKAVTGDATKGTTDALDDGSAGDDGTGDGASSGDDATGTKDVPPAKKLPLPDCAHSCDKCALCPDAYMCVDGQTYVNDCFAICALQDYDWPKGHKLFQGKCPDCPNCKAGEKPGDKPQFCAKTKAGPWVPVMLECELACVELPDDKDSCKDGKCVKGGVDCKNNAECNKKYIMAGGCEKQNACMQAPASCPVAKFQPVCASDGESYQTPCAMNNCDLKGCYPLFSETKSAGCKGGQLKKLCDGECYDSDKWKACAGDKDCKPVCGIHKDGEGISYRNSCIANLEGASVANCKGIVVQDGKCSAELYSTANDSKGRGCCDIDYSIVKPVCASRTPKDGKASWYTFRSNAEFDCLVADPEEKKLWNFQYLGPCVCQCPNVSKPVCGADGQTYQSGCEAQCYGGKNFQWKPGAC